MATKHIHIHVGGKVRDTVQPATLTEAKRKAEALVRFLNSPKVAEMAEGDFKEGYKALTSAYNWLS